MWACHICSLLMVIYPIYSDMREQKINIVPAIGLLGAGTMVMFLSGEFEVAAWFVGMIPGWVVWFISKVFRDCIGLGDVILIGSIGALEGAWFSLRLLVIACVNIFVFSIAMMVLGRLHRKSRIACVPFLLIGYLGASFL